MATLGRRLAATLGLAGAVVACNALTGASDLSVCDGAECDSALDLPGRTPGRSDAGDGAAGAADAALPPTCVDGEKRCSGATRAVCVGSSWVLTPCAVACDAGECVDAPSCRNAAGVDCGAAKKSCCESLAVPGGTFDRGATSFFDPGDRATVSPFRLDTFEVTVGRFRAFVDAGGGTRLKPPAPGAGAHPKIPGSGWLPEWNALLAADSAALRSELVGTNATWTPAAGPNEHRPVNYVRWFTAFAFCVWDGGRLPTYAEWGFAAAGGSEQRVYPWSSPPGLSFITSSNASYDCRFSPPARTCPASRCTDGSSSPCDTSTCLAPQTCETPPCTGCAMADVAPVGVLTAGNGKWGHADLAGNLAEMVLDRYPDPRSDLPEPCVDCALLMGPDPERAGSRGRRARVYVLGGSWSSSSTSSLRTGETASDDYRSPSSTVGFRCARD